tara:strand:- start:126 stop:833 length:708 start_codon:yes stop_codon:yes gene_type:complete
MEDFLRPSLYPVMLSPDFAHAWINVPKNCSSFVQKVLDDNGWHMLGGDITASILSANDIKKIVVLRDPVQRWISGFAETFGYWNTEKQQKIDLDKLDNLLENDVFWDLVYTNPVMCFHTELQHRYIGNAKNVQYIKMQDKHANSSGVTDPNRFYRELTEYVRWTNGTSNFTHWTELTNPVTNDEGKLRVYNKILEVMNKNAIIKDKLTQVHELDYRLFYELTRFTTNATATDQPN